MKKKGYAWNKKRLAELKALVKEAKNIPCMDCNISYPTYVMDLDHVRGEKDFNLGQINHSISLSRVKDEIAKCEVVCANCHRIRTIKRKASLADRG